MAGTQIVDSESKISADLVERIGRRDTGAEEEFCARYYQRLYYFIRRRCRGDDELARDVCQQACMICLEKLREGQVQNSASLGSFLHGIAINLVRSEFRRSESRATDTDLELIESAAAAGAGPLDELSNAEVSRIVREHLEGLSESDRNVLVRLYLREEDRESICRSEGYTAKQFNNIVWRAKERLKKQLLEAASSADAAVSSITQLR